MFDASIRSKIAKLPNTNGVAAQSGEDGKNLVADGVEEGVPDIETHTAHLLNLLNELRSFADQAYDEADLKRHRTQSLPSWKAGFEIRKPN